MFAKHNQSLRHSFSAAAAVTVVALAGLTVEFGHANGLPEGRVEIGELQPVNLELLAAVTLPGIVVTAGRLTESDTPPALHDLPEHEVRLAQAGTASGVSG